MKKLAKLCCINHDTKEEEQQPELRPELQLQQHLEPPSREDSESQSKKSSFQPYPIGQEAKVLQARMRENVLFVKEIRFLPDGDTHSVIIRFNNSRTEMTLKVDGKTIDKVKNIEENQGNIELNIDGLAVDFVWDFVHFPMSFSFYTRNFPSNTGAASSSNYRGDDNYAELDSQAKYGKDYTHIHMVQILGD